MNPDRDDGPVTLNAEERHEMIAVAAYYLAEKRGFPGAGALEDWIEAEHQIDTMIQRMHRDGLTRRALDRVGLRNALRMWSEGGEEAGDTDTGEGKAA
jgi:hypothetical protein